MATHILGIRHHGPGSALQVKAFLDIHKPDAVLIEGPPDANHMLSHVSADDMLPPVALLLYDKKNPGRASFYPFAAFSPEWQAIHWALRNNAHVAFMDLPTTHYLAMEADQPEVPAETKEEEEAEGPKEVEPYPLDYLAQIAGFDHTDAWWEHRFELGGESEDHFDAVMHGMAALRESGLGYNREKDDLREAFMRTILYKTEANYEDVAVICGAWHAPVLENRPPKKQDKALMKGLKKCPIECTWIPWTYDRLSFESGYGAGIWSPGWYEHVWNISQENRSISWMTKVARILREAKMDISTAHVIEAVKLADNLAAIRNMARPGLEEFNDATQTVLSFGDHSLLNLVEKELIVGQKMGRVPEEVPAVPLQQDLQRLQKSLRLKVSDEYKQMTLDLRKEMDLNRSLLFHRLNLLGIGWAEKGYVAGLGTFKEQWTLNWKPQWVLKTIEMGIWGNTVIQASNAFAKSKAKKSKQLAETIKLLSTVLSADLKEAAFHIISRVDKQAARSGDIFQLVQAMTPLVEITRYGGVRNTDVSVLYGVLDSIISRVTIGLGHASTSIDEETSLEAIKWIGTANQSLHTYQNETYLKEWYAALRNLATSERVAPAISGKACRLLSDHLVFGSEDVAQRLSLALSTARDVSYSSGWLEGFLSGGSVYLLLEDEIFNVLDDWLGQLTEDDFTDYLPVLRRSFSWFSQAERRQIGNRAKNGSSKTVDKLEETSFNHERGMQATYMVATLLGLNGQSE
ncbi:MAG: DUF5682 family protein [Bacteroidota bacterium]